MPRGTPDWRVNWTPRTIWGLDDLGEHAVRLGSPHLWDRRGDVYYSTDFSEGLGALSPIEPGVGDVVCLHTGRSRQGAFCVKLTPGSVAWHTAGLQALLPLPRVSGMGLEFSFSTDDGHDFWQWSLSWWLGVDHYTANVQFDLANDWLQYWGHDRLWHTFAEDIAWLNFEYITNTGKLVVDSVRWEYNRFLLNNAEYDLRRIPVRHEIVPPVLAETHFDAFLYLIGDPPENFPGYVDSVIVTQNEPM